MKNTGENHAVLLNVLSDLQPASVELIASQTGLTEKNIRVSVDWLSGIGVPIEWQEPASIRLLRPVIPLSREQICKSVAVHDPVLASRLSLFESIDSTNEFLLNFSDRLSLHKRVCISEYMYAGRGRRRRKWHSGAFQNIMMSIAWEFSGGVASFAGLSLAVAVMTTRCLNQLGEAYFQVKWPNDILWRNRKVCGILVEIRGAVAVIGIGINCEISMPEKSEITQPIVGLNEIFGYTVDRDRLLARLLISLSKGLDQFSREKLEPFREEWLNRHVYSNQRIRTDGVPALEGKALGIDATGALLIELDNRTVVPVQSGEISLHRQEPH